MPEPSWLGAVDNAHVPMRVTWSPTLGYANVDSEVRAVCERAVGVFEELGGTVVERDMVFPEDPVWPWLTLAGSYLLRSVDALRGTEAWQRLDPSLLALVEVAAGFSTVDLVKAEDQCYLLNLRLVELFHESRLLVTPTCAAAAPLSGEPGLIDGKPDENWVRFTYPFNLTRSPAATVCAGFTDDGLPVGLQLVGPQHGDLVVLRAAVALEEALDLDAVAPLEA
jgi:aspartyl-tRNA(Asn)/glutamyl-tRNA(Gln) amidotransferase subunit A